MQWPRSSGILLHMTSLPGGHGIGDLGPMAREFADWLAEGRQKFWQMLPLGPTGYGDSPYQTLSAFAGNTLLVSLDDLVRDGLLEAGDLAESPANSEFTSFEQAAAFKLPRLSRAFNRFERGQAEFLRDELEEFVAKNAWWLEDYAFFSALKRENGQRAWIEWPRPIRLRDNAALNEARERLRNEIAQERFAQFLFLRQWGALRDYCHARAIRLMGDLPIYVAHDSADVWSHRDLFLLDEQGRATQLAGVPPDYFSATGQLWGNPIYDWPRHEANGFAWWIERVRATLAQFDYIRIDHFRGFEAYWAVPGGDTTAQRGQWVKAPGRELFEALQNALGKLPVLAENLGVITAEVEALRIAFQLPGMAILQFAFGADPQAPCFKPHNYTFDRIAYTGTHDNDTVMGWWQRREATATETKQDIRKQHEYAALYLGIREGDEANWAFIRALMASVATVAIFPMQDVLGLGTESRMNYPGTSSGNWRWRMLESELRSADAHRLRQVAETFDR
jgi:4-alpha-glucanotransferase